MSKIDSRSLPNLKIQLKDAEKILIKQIEEGKQIKDSSITNINLLHQAEKKYNIWNSYNFKKLKQLFATKTIAKEYSSLEWSIGGILISDLTLQEKTSKFLNNIQQKINKLSSVKASLELLESKKLEKKNKIFFVHGGDTNFSQTIIDFLNKSGFKLIILQEIAHAGKTIIDVVENTDIKYAIVLLSPTLEEGSKADQNVILELGIFIGKLGRKNVSCLYEKNPELPADYHGFRYIKIDSKNKWQKTLLEEIKASDLEINLKKR